LPEISDWLLIGPARLSAFERGDAVAGEEKAPKGVWTRRL
jgi:hypothetical protein